MAGNAVTVAKEYTFIWEGTDRKGQRVKGQSVGPSESMIKTQLRKQGVNPLKVRRQSTLFASAKKKKITTGDIAIFSRQMATMMSSGVPLVQAVVLSIVFTHVVTIGSSYASTSRSYAVFLYSALVPWNYIANAGPAASTAIVDNVALAGKIYFPRALPVLVTAASAIYPLAVGILLLLVMAVTVGGGVGVSFLLVVPGAALAVLFVVCVGLCLSALHVYFRDIRYIVMAILSVGFYLTPIIYPLSRLSDSHPTLRALIAMGPGAGPIEIFRAATVGADSALTLAVSACAVWCVVLGGIGFWLQCRRDRVFVDLL